MVQQPKNLDDEAVRAADSKAKGKMKEYADVRANAKYSPVRVGDIVFILFNFFIYDNFTYNVLCSSSYSSAAMLKQA